MQAKGFKLYWLSKESGRRHPAGVAFFNESSGDYRLKIDVMPEEKLVYLKAITSTEKVIHYRVETAIRKQGRVTHRAEIGSGYANLDEGFPVYMDVGPYERQLVMEPLE